MKKFLKVFMVALMAVTLVACGSSKDEAKDDGKQTVTVWAWDKTFNIAAMEEAKKVYDNKDVEIKIVEMAQDDIVQKLNTSLSSGKIDGLPDIVLIEDYRIQNFLTAYADKFADLSDVVNPEDFDAYKSGVNQFDGKTYGVPFDSGVSTVYYNTEVLKEAGYTIEDVQDITWEKYIEIGKAVKEKTGKEMLTLNPSDIGQIRMMIQSAGAWYMEDDGETVNIENNQALKDAIKIYKDMNDAGIVKPISDWDAFVSTAQNVEVASTPTGCWFTSSITANADGSGKFAIASLPRMGANADSKNASNLGGSGWYVINTDNADAAKAFLKDTFATNADLMSTLAENIGVVSTMKAAADTDAYKAENAYFQNQPTLEMMAEWSGNIPTVNFGLHTYAIEAVVAEAVEKIMNGADVDATLKDAQKQAEGQVVQ